MIEKDFGSFISESFLLITAKFGVMILQFTHIRDMIQISRLKIELIIKKAYIFDERGG